MIWKLGWNIFDSAFRRCGQSILLCLFSAWMTVEVRLLKYYGRQVSVCHQALSHYENDITFWRVIMNLKAAIESIVEITLFST